MVAWDAVTLRPLAPAVVWGCRRSQPIVDRLEAAGHGAEIEAAVGPAARPLLLGHEDPLAGRERCPPVAAAAADGRLRVGTLDAYLCARLGDGARTEPSTAGRTQLQALRAPGGWDPRAARAARRRRRAGCRRSGDVGRATSAQLCGLPLRGAAGRPDRVPGRARLPAPGHGEGDLRHRHLRAAARRRASRRQTWRACCRWWPGSCGGRTTYALDGGVFSAGTVVRWLRDGLGAFEDRGRDRGAGALGAGHRRRARSCRRWPGWARRGGAPTRGRCSRGITAGTTPRAPRAGRAGRALLPRARHRRRAARSGRTLLRVDGGLTANGYLVQRQADVLGIPVRGRAGTPETTALGAAAMAGVGAGLFSLDDLAGAGRRRTGASSRATSAPEADYRAWRRFASGRPCGSRELPRQLVEVADRAERRGHVEEQLQPVAAHGRVGIHHQHLARRSG